MLTIEIVTEAKFYWWRIKSRNRQILLTSEGYSRVRDARRAAKRFVDSSCGHFSITDLTKK
jgi:uncharacterized protein YegP (UPF0339 family)